jgi:hypothetical protein
MAGNDVHVNKDMFVSTRDKAKKEPEDELIRIAAGQEPKVYNDDSDDNDEVYSAEQYASVSSTIPPATSAAVLTQAIVAASSPYETVTTEAHKDQYTDTYDDDQNIGQHASTALAGQSNSYQQPLNTNTPSYPSASVPTNQGQQTEEEDSEEKYVSVNYDNYDIG